MIHRSIDNTLLVASTIFVASHLDYSAPREATDAEGMVQSQAACRDHLDLGDVLRAELHHRALAVGHFHLLQRRYQGKLLLCNRFACFLCIIFEIASVKERGL